MERKKGKKEKKHVAHGIAHVHASFNNTVVTITDLEGNVVSWSSAGAIGFKGSRKGTPFAATQAAIAAGNAAKTHGLRQHIAQRVHLDLVRVGFDLFQYDLAHFALIARYRDGITKFFEQF